MAGLIAIADDLTGAADCAAAVAGHGMRATVLLYAPGPRHAQFEWPLCEILSIDANTRALSAAQSSAAAADVVRLGALHGAFDAGCLLFKKLDSTLRGNWAAELAAIRHEYGRLAQGLDKPRVILAPALPAQGRTTVDGRQRVHGRPVEETEFWEKNSRGADASMAAMLADAGLSSRLADLGTVRAGVDGLRPAMERLTHGADVLICDAETDDDLRRIAEASAGLEGRTVWAGSAGLAWHLPQAAGIAAADAEAEPTTFAPGPTLFVVGTLEAMACQQARVLAGAPEAITVRARPGALLASQVDSTAILEGLRSGRDVLVWVDESERCAVHQAPLLVRALAKAIAPYTALAGGLVVTGGETARALFDELGIRRLRLLGEVEPGLPFAVAENWSRALPVLTKAGGFGSAGTLVRCREFLKSLERDSAAANATRSPVC
ncbi:MAG: four-carbon acid sugar kinase family protein [Acidobacteriota bacterium]